MERYLLNYLLDTDILVNLLRGDAETIENMEQKNVTVSDASTSVLSIFELMEGAYLANSERELVATMDLINNLQILDLNKRIASEAGKISSSLKKKGKSIGIGDILIGATAVVENKILVTRNTKHFSVISNIKIISW